MAVMVEQSMAGIKATPRHLYREYPLSLGRITELTEAVLRPGAGTGGNLKDRDQIIVFAATLGCGADHLIQKRCRLR